MAIIKSVGDLTNDLAKGGTALSLLGVTKAFLTSKKLPSGIAGFLFDIPDSENLTLSAEVTDHYVEQNYAIQDHVAFTPVKITLTGVIGDLVYEKSKVATYLETVLDRLGPLGVIQPALSKSVKRGISQFERLTSAVNTAVDGFKDVASMFSSEPNLNRQQQAYKTLEGLFNARAQVTVETPWKTFESMLIESLSFDQSGDSKNYTTITATFKQIRIVQVTTNVGRLKGRIKEQSSDPVNSGKTEGKSVLRGLKDFTVDAAANLFGGAK